jgi:hypothetical protein
MGKAVTVKSAADAAILSHNYGIGVEFSSGEGPASILSNFVITGCNIGIYVVSDDSLNTGSPAIINTTIAGNTLGLYSDSNSIPHIKNCIFWNNIQSDIIDPAGCLISYSCIEDNNNGETNICLDPLFTDPSNYDYHLLSRWGRFLPAANQTGSWPGLWVMDEITSPCIDTGDPNTNPMGELIHGGGRINMGAYANTPYASKSEWLLEGDVNNDGIVNLSDFTNLASNWFRVPPWLE